MEKRIGVIGIFIRERQDTVVPEVNSILSAHAELICARMGIPFREKSVNVISLIIEASTDEVGSFTGKLGQIEGVRVKSFVI